MIPAKSLLDLATIGKGESHAEALHGSVEYARVAEQCGYDRIWYAEHHNMRAIASSAPPVLIAHIAAHTDRIKLGAGGVMLPNHAPLTVAEQFGTLANLHPGRIELGLGRAPGTDPITLRALRRDERAAEHFPEDVLELQGYLSGNTRIRGIHAIPGSGTNVPLYILGSSLFGASLAARLGLPYAFASHFAPDMMVAAINHYRENFQPSEQLDKPRAMAAVNVIAADTTELAEDQLHRVRKARLAMLLSQGDRVITDDEAEMLLDTPQGEAITSRFNQRAVGTPQQVRTQLEEFAQRSGADELILCHTSASVEERLTSLKLTAEALD